MTSAPGSEQSFFEAIGGHETFSLLVQRFYAGVREDPQLAPMYPDSDWEGAAWRLEAFLEQYWGGPTTYSRERGHPRLRLRHQPFLVTPSARDRWLAHMRAAVLSLNLSPLHEGTLWDYLERAAHAMVNSAEPDASSNAEANPMIPPAGRSLL